MWKKYSAFSPNPKSQPPNPDHQLKTQNFWGEQKSILQKTAPFIIPPKASCL
jgi:hypothetical protein